MTPKQFSVLAAAAALSLLAAIAVYTARVPWSAASIGSGRLLPAFDTLSPNLARIDITQTGNTVALEKSGDQWLIKSQDGYPASSEKVRALVLALSDARLVEPKTRNPARLSLLEVDDPASKTSNARLIKLLDASGATLAEVIAGKSRPGQAGTSVAGTYVRRPGEDQSWLASTSIIGTATLRDWASPRVFETQTEKIARVGVEVKGEAPYDIKRGTDGSHALQDIPAGKKIKYVNMVDNTIEAASFLDLETVRKAEGAAGDDAGTVTLETDNGLKVVMKIRRDKDKAWAAVEATGEGEAKAAAADIMTRAKGWEFEILPAKVSTMLKKKDELLEDAPS